MKKDGPVNFGALEEICDAAILYIVSTVYTEGFPSHIPLTKF